MSLLKILHSKIHNVKVTEANLNYVGSITIDRRLMDEAGLLPWQEVFIVNNNNGARFETYVIPGKTGSRKVCLNGSAARQVQVGDVIIIMNYHMVDMTKWQDREFETTGDGGQYYSTTQRLSNEEYYKNQHHPRVVMMNEEDGCITAFNAKGEDEDKFITE